MAKSATFPVVLLIGALAPSCERQKAAETRLETAAPAPTAPYFDFLHLTLISATRDEDLYTFKVELRNTSLHVVHVYDPRVWNQFWLIQHLKDGSTTRSRSDVMIDAGSFSGFILRSSDTLVFEITGQYNHQGGIHFDKLDHTLDVHSNPLSVSIMAHLPVADYNEKKCDDLFLETAPAPVEFPFPLSDKASVEEAHKPLDPSSGGVLPLPTPR